MKYLIQLISVILIIGACNDSKDVRNKLPEGNSDKANNPVGSLTGIQADPYLSTTDSIQVIYYKEAVEDSLRRHRYFTFTSTKDTGIVESLIKNLDVPFDASESVRPCRSEGKIFLFNGEKELHTVYFSTKCDSYGYLYFIRDGIFLYFPLSKDLRNQLLKQKSKSREA